tara:strand:- start:2926 stop:5547 length:2622 start_codon:yes stop_codon:yes gene_type:complete
MLNFRDDDEEENEEEPELGDSDDDSLDQDSADEEIESLAPDVPDVGDDSVDDLGGLEIIGGERQGWRSDPELQMEMDNASEAMGLSRQYETDRENSVASLYETGEAAGDRGDDLDPYREQLSAGVAQAYNNPAVQEAGLVGASDPGTADARVSSPEDRAVLEQALATIGRATEAEPASAQAINDIVDEDAVIEEAAPPIAASVQQEERPVDPVDMYESPVPWAIEDLPTGPPSVEVSAPEPEPPGPDSGSTGTLNTPEFTNLGSYLQARDLVAENPDMPVVEIGNESAPAASEPTVESAEPLPELALRTPDWDSTPETPAAATQPTAEQPTREEVREESSEIVQNMDPKRKAALREDIEQFESMRRNSREAAARGAAPDHTARDIGDAFLRILGRLPRALSAAAGNRTRSGPTLVDRVLADRDRREREEAGRQERAGVRRERRAERAAARGERRAERAEDRSARQRERAEDRDFRADQNERNRAIQIQRMAAEAEARRERASQAADRQATQNWAAKQAAGARQAELVERRRHNVATEATRNRQVDQRARRGGSGGRGRGARGGSSAGAQQARNLMAENAPAQRQERLRAMTQEERDNMNRDLTRRANADGTEAERAHWRDVLSRYRVDAGYASEYREPPIIGTLQRVYRGQRDLPPMDATQRRNVAQYVDSLQGAADSLNRFRTAFDNLGPNPTQAQINSLRRQQEPMQRAFEALELPVRGVIQPGEARQIAARMPGIENMFNRVWSALTDGDFTGSSVERARETLNGNINYLNQTSSAIERNWGFDPNSVRRYIGMGSGRSRPRDQSPNASAPDEAAQTPPASAQTERAEQTRPTLTPTQVRTIYDRLRGTDPQRAEQYRAYAEEAYGVTLP